MFLITYLQLLVSSSKLIRRTWKIWMIRYVRYSENKHPTEFRKRTKITLSKNHAEISLTKPPLLSLTRTFGWTTTHFKQRFSILRPLRRLSCLKTFNDARPPHIRPSVLPSPDHGHVLANCACQQNPAGRPVRSARPSVLCLAHKRLPMTFKGHRVSAPTTSSIRTRHVQPYPYGRVVMYFTPATTRLIWFFRFSFSRRAMCTNIKNTCLV